MMQLNVLTSETDQREQNQAAELKKAEDEETERRRIRREKQQAAIIRSRTMQIQMKESKRKQKMEDDARLAQHYRQRNLQVEGEEQAEEMERIVRNVKVRKALERQIDEKRRVKMQERAQKLLVDEETVQVMQEEDARFRRTRTGRGGSCWQERDLH